jgi:hypothetical protein
MSYNFRKIALVTTFSSLGILGFKRGTNSYKYTLEKYNKRLEKKENFFYSQSYTEGVIGSFMYMFPILWVPILINEIYRLEVNIRNLEDEKKTDRYNRII